MSITLPFVLMFRKRFNQLLADAAEGGYKAGYDAAKELEAECRKHRTSITKPKKARP